MVLRLLFLAALALAQSIPECQSACQTTALASSGCSTPSAPCACDPAYQTAMLDCLAKPTSSGGCTYDQIITWMNGIQTQCFLSPPILPPCRTICPLQGEQAAGCSSSVDLACVCSSTYTSSTTSCLQSACPNELEDWQDGHLNDCSAYSSSTSSLPPTSTATTQTSTTDASSSSSSSSSSDSNSSSSAPTGLSTSANTDISASSSTTTTTTPSAADPRAAKTLSNLALGIIWGVMVSVML